MGKILLTGGAGFIGSHTAVEFMEAGYDVVIADNLSNSEESVINRIQAITGKEAAFYKVDVADKAAMNRLFEEQEIDAVVHFAGYKAVGESVEKPLSYYRNNLDTTLTLLEAMKEHGCENFIFSSSATVYSLVEDVPFTEESGPLGCTNPYGWTKYMIEQILKDACVSDPEMSVVLLRYFNPIGAHESGLIGEKPNGIPNNLMPYITQVAEGIRPQLNVFGNDYPTPDGTGVRDYIHVVDLAKGHVAALKYSQKHKGCEVFNLGTGQGYSVLDLVKTFEKVNELKIPYEIVERRPGDIATCYAGTDKAEKVLGWKAEKGIEDMCRDSWRWQQKSAEVEKIKAGLMSTPCYRVEITDDPAEITDSKLGGVPYWPSDREYPGDKVFLAQINMKDIPDNTEFPKEGILQFFLGTSDGYGLFDGDYLVVFHKEIGTPAEVSLCESENTPVEKPGKILIGEKTTEKMSVCDYRFPETDEDSIYLDPELFGEGSKLLGYPCFIQYDPRDYEEDKQKYDTLLLQLDSDSGYVYWGFQGLGSFFINGQKLKEGDFSDVMYNWDCF